jgi:hypothetical protein
MALVNADSIEQHVAGLEIATWRLVCFGIWWRDGWYDCFNAGTKPMERASR